jgi:hypothetical protein
MQQLDMDLKPTNARKCIMYVHALTCIVGFDFRMPRNRLPVITQKYRLARGKNHRRPLKRPRFCETRAVQPVVEHRDSYIVVVVIIVIIV